LPFDIAEIAHALPEFLPIYTGRLCKPRRQKSDSGNFLRLLRFGKRAERKEYGAKRNAEDALANY